MLTQAATILVLVVTIQADVFQRREVGIDELVERMAYPTEIFDRQPVMASRTVGSPCMSPSWCDLGEKCTKGKCQLMWL